MKHLHTTFAEVYKNSEGDFLVFGSLTATPIYTPPISYPNINLIHVQYWVSELPDENVSVVLQNRRDAFLTPINDKFSIGRIFNQSFKEESTPFLDWLK